MIILLITALVVRTMNAQDSTTQLVQQDPERAQDPEDTLGDKDASIALDIEEGVVPVKDLDDASPDSNGIGETTPLTQAADTTHDNIELDQLEKKKVHLSKEVYSMISLFFCGRNISVCH